MTIKLTSGDFFQEEMKLQRLNLSKNRLDDKDLPPLLEALQVMIL